MVFDLVELYHLSHLIIDKGCAIITDDPTRYSKPNNYVFLDKICHCPSCGLAEWYRFHLLGKILRSH